MELVDIVDENNRLTGQVDSGETDLLKNKRKEILNNKLEQ